MKFYNFRTIIAASVKIRLSTTHKNRNHNTQWKGKHINSQNTSTIHAANAAGASVSPSAAHPKVPVITDEHGPRTKSPSAPNKKAPKNSSGKAFGRLQLIITVILIALILFLFVYFFKPFGLFQEKLDLKQPTQFQVQAVYEEVDIPFPNLTRFQYVNSNDLRMANIGQFTSTPVEYGSDRGRPSATSEGRGVANYRNGNINVAQSLALQMQWDTELNDWVPGAVLEESVEVVPTDLPNVDQITSDISTILTKFDPALAEMYKNAEATATPELDLDGGTIKFNIATTDAEGVAKACEAESTVKWSNTSGWDVNITTVSGDVAAPEQEAAAEEAAAEQEATIQEGQPATPVPEQPQAPSNNTKPPANDYGGATLSLVCATGDFIGIDGTIQFDPSGHILLKTDQRIFFILDEHQYITDYFEVEGSSFTNGTHLFLAGYISATGKLPQAPLLINSNY